MTAKIEQILDIIIRETKGDIIGFLVNVKTKNENNMPEEYKGLRIVSDFLTPLDNIYSIPKP
jgi:hypothetical protein